MRRSTGHETAHFCAHLSFKHTHTNTPSLDLVLAMLLSQANVLQNVPAKYAIENAALQQAEAVAAAAA